MIESTGILVLAPKNIMKRTFGVKLPEGIFLIHKEDGLSLNLLGSSVSVRYAPQDQFCLILK